MSNKQRILIVEDEPTSRALLAGYLENLEYEVFVADSVAEAKKFLQSKIIDILLLDIGLPDQDGLSFATALRQNSKIPIIFVTARDGSRDKIAALELGADDYIVKPYHPKELELRLRKALLRSNFEAPSACSSSQSSFSNYILDHDRHLVSHQNGEIINLTRAELSLLETLVAARGRTLSREQLLEAVSPEQKYETFDRTIDVLVSRIRKKMDRNLIVTVPIHGYRLNI